MLKYWRYFTQNFHEEAAYKADMILYVGFNIVFFAVNYFLWTTVYNKSGVSEISSFSLQATITYYFITGLLFRINPGDAIYLNREIWNGWITNELPRPYSVKFIYIVSSFALMTFEFITYLPFAAILLLIAYKYIIFVSLAYFLLFIVSIILASVMGICLFLFLHSLCFHFGDQDANISLLGYIFAFVGGGFFPLSFLPDSFEKIFQLLPFKYLFDFPASVYLGKVSTHDIYFGFFNMIAWTLIFLAIYYISFEKGLKKYAAIGR